MHSMIHQSNVRQLIRAKAYPEKSIEAVFIVEALFWWLRKVSLQTDHDDLWKNKYTVGQLVKSNWCGCRRTSWVSNKTRNTTSYTEAL